MKVILEDGREFNDIIRIWKYEFNPYQFELITKDWESKFVKIYDVSSIIY